jgi:hypothetical protein
MYGLLRSVSKIGIKHGIISRRISVRDRNIGEQRNWRDKYFWRAVGAVVCQGVVVGSVVVARGSTW